MGTKLAKLQIDEVSGVDDPANEIPGWLLAKSKDLEGVIEEVEAAHNGLLKSITDADKYLEDAPEDVQAAAALLKTHVTSLADTDDDRRSFIGRALSYFKRKEEIEMTKDELLEALNAHTEAMTAAVGDAISKAVAEATPAAPVEPEAKETEKVDETEDVAKTVSVEDFEKLTERVEAIAEVVSKSADALTAIIQKSAKRTALDGQEDEVSKGKDNKPSALGQAFAQALRGERVDLR